MATTKKNRPRTQYDPWLEALAKSKYPKDGFPGNKSSRNETKPLIDQIVTTCQGKALLPENYNDAVHVVRILLSVFTLHGINYYPKGEEPEGCLPFPISLYASSYSIAYSLVGLLSMSNLCPHHVLFSPLGDLVRRFVLTMHELGYEFYFTGYRC